MSQILLNDPHRIGGSSALDLNEDIGIVGGFNAAKLALWAADINAMFAELYALSGFQIGAAVAFSTTIPLTTTCYMPPQTVTGPLAFTPGASPTAGSSCTVRLTADGVHTPTFSGFSVVGTFDNTAGAVNLLSFAYETGATVAVVQDGATTGVPKTAPAVASISVVHGVNPSIVIAMAGTALNTAAIPPASAFTLSTTQGATINTVAASANAITLNLAGAVAIGDTVTLSYTPPPLNAVTLRGNGLIQDINHNCLAAITGASVSVS